MRIRLYEKKQSKRILQKKNSIFLGFSYPSLEAFSIQDFKEGDRSIDNRGRILTLTLILEDIAEDILDLLNEKFEFLSF